MSQDRILWRSFEELTNNPDFLKEAGNEFNLPAPGEAEPGDGPNRRDFLKLMGFGIAATTLAACEAPVRKAIPYLAKPEELDPSMPNWYASTYMEDGEYSSILVKTRESRPIKIEGNRLSSITRGSTSSRVQASVLSVYDQTRFRQPEHKGAKASWVEADAAIGAALAAAAGKGVRLVTPTIASPSFQALVRELSAKWPNFKHIVYDALPYSGIIKANQATLGQPIVPNYDFSKVSTVVSFDADFLGSWISGPDFGRQWARTRRLNKTNKQMSRMYHIGPLLSLTSANADERVLVKASAMGLYVAALQSEVAGRTGGAASGVTVPEQARIAKMADDLVASKGRALVISGSNDPAVQTMVNAINMAVGSYGNAININSPMLTRVGTEDAFEGLMGELKSGSVGAVLFYKANPAYTHPNGASLKAALGNTFTVSLSERPDETSALCEWVTPDHNFLESWGDAEPRPGFYSLQQPTIRPIFETRQAAETLMKWAGIAGTYYDYVRNVWRGGMFPRQSEHKSFSQFWNYALHDGIFEVGRQSLRGRDFSPKRGVDDDASYVYMTSAATAPASFNADVAGAASAIQTRYKAGTTDLELVMYEKSTIGSGNHSNNPWLMELPDPITRVTWENYVTISPAKAKELDINFSEGIVSTVKLTVGGKEMTLPAVVQPGQEKNTLGLAIGFGRTVAGPAAKGIGVNAYPFTSMDGNMLVQHVAKPGLAKAGDDYELAHVQTSHTYAGRPVVQEASFKDYLKNPAAGRDFPIVQTPEGPKKPELVTNWKTEVNKRPNHAWGMMIDLNSCFGCGACVASCNVENNIPVVGKKEVYNRREMHWIRIDRYYSSIAKDLNDTNEAKETAADNPDVVFQPMLCQHCNNAPCETVCPVLATTHSTEGLNQMAYNRCIGTRYCANNCPYKVRRFNWFSYPQNKENFPLNPANDALQRMVLNPDVTVRARGVMEKCTFCIQRIQDGKLNAKKEGRRPIDGEITTACAQACPSDAIVFGDMNDPESNISRMIEEQYEERQFHVLQEINTRPNVSYLTKIRNKA